MKRLCSVLMMTVGLGFGQEKVPAAAPAPQEMKVFQIKNADVNRLTAMLSIFGARLEKDASLRLISVSGTREQVKAIEDAITRFDVAPPAQKNVDLTFYLLLATGAGTTEKLPAELDPVVKQLQSTFSYRGYRLMDTLVGRIRDGEAMESSSNPKTEGEPSQGPTSVQLRVGRVSVGSNEKVNMVRLDTLRVLIRTPACATPGQQNCTMFQQTENAIVTSLDLREGQKVVVGKTTLPRPDSAVILVVTAKVVE